MAPRSGVFLLLLLSAACGSKSDRTHAAEHEPGAARGDGDASTIDARQAAFVRVSPDKLADSYWRRAAAGDEVGHMEIVGTFTCKLEALFGPPDPFVPQSTGPDVVGFPLKHVATGELVAALPENYGIAGVSFEETPTFKRAADELESVLATTTPRDCEHTFAGAYRVSRAGVRGGTPFFEDAGFVPTLDFRLAQFEHNDEQADTRRKLDIEDKLCESLRQNWKERRDTKGRIDPMKAGYPRRDEVERRLRRCLETNLADLEPDVAGDWFDYDAVPGIVDDEVAAFEDLELDDPMLRTRLYRLRATTKQKAAKLRRGK